MARMAAADGISIIACTPHILPGVYNNDGPRISAAVAELQGKLDEAGIPLVLTTGADVHVAPDLLDGLRSGRIPSLRGSRYLLLEPPQTIVPPRFDDYLFSLVSAGYVPIITHPERLAWPDSDYGVFERIVRLGGWMQLTGGSLLGRFGQRAQALAERMLEDGLAHILATDAHNVGRRPPRLSDAWQAARAFVGEEEAFRLVSTRPAGILKDVDPNELPLPVRPEARRGQARRERLARS